MYGVFFMLFLALFVYVLWDSRQREKRLTERSTEREDKYIEVIGTLSEDVKERLTVIETHLSINRK